MASKKDETSKLGDDSADEALSNAERVGRLFSKARKKLGHSIEDVSADIHVRQFYLDAIENGQLDMLPGQIYRVGFVRAYALFLGLDDMEILRKLELASTPSDLQSFDALPSPIPEKGLPTRGLITFSLFLTLALVASYFFWQRLNEPISVDDIMPLSSEFKELLTGVGADEPSAPGDEENDDDLSATQDPTLIAGGSGEGAGVPAAQPSAAIPDPVQEAALSATEKHQKGVYLKVIQPTWVEIRKNLPNGKSEVAFSRILKPGELYPVPTGKGVFLKTGNAGGTELILDGKNYGTFGSEGEVKRHISLDIPSLKNRFQKH